MLQIRKINQFFLTLCGIEAVSEQSSHMEQRVKNSFIGLHGRKDLLLPVGIHRPYHLVHAGFDLCPNGFELLSLICILLFFRSPGKACKCSRRACIVPVSICFSGGKITAHGKITLSRLEIGGGTIRLIGKRKVFAGQFQHLINDEVRIPHIFPHPRRLAQFFKVLRAVALFAHQKPGRRIRLALCGTKYFIDDFLKAVLIFIRRESLYQSIEGIPLLTIFHVMKLHEKIRHDIFPQKVQLPAISDTISRFQICQMTVAPQNIGAESIYRRNLRIMYKGRLTHKMFIVGILLQSGGNRLRDALPHLTGSCACKGDNEKIIDIHFILQYICHNPGDKNRCLAAAGRGADKNIVAAARYYLFLVNRPFHIISSLFVPLSSLCFHA